MLGQVDKLSVETTKDFAFMSSRKKLCRGFIHTFPSAYAMSYFFVEKAGSKRGKKKRIKIRVAVSLSINWPKTT